MKKSLLPLFMLLTAIMSKAQQPALTWAKNMGGKAADYGYGLAVDSKGNIYSTGYFNDTAVFDPGTGLNTLISAGKNDIFIQKRDVLGNLLWVRKIGGKLSDMGRCIKVDAQNNVYLTGLFADTVDFDPGGGTSIMAAAGDKGGADAFILKLDANGDFLWARQMGGITVDMAFSIAIDPAGNIITTGDFNGIADFDPGAGISYLMSKGDQDVFISKLDPNGDFLWARNMGGRYEEHGNSVLTDNAGNVYVTGYFQDTADFDPGIGVHILKAYNTQNAFIMKLDASGNFVWANGFGGSMQSDAFSMAMSKAGYLYVTGYFEGKFNVKLDSTITNIVTLGAEDAYILKLDTDGNNKWIKCIGGKSSDYGFAIAVDNDDNSYLTGTMQGDVDFDPGIGTKKIKLQGLRDQFILKLDDSGNFVWANTIKASGSYVNGFAIETDTVNNFYCMGAFTGTVDFNPEPGVFDMKSAGADDIFIYKMNQNGIPVSIEENPFLSGALLYPNPTSGLLNIRLDNSSDKVNIEIYNTFGSLVYYQMNAESIIDLRELASGLYVVKVITDNMVVATQKVIKE